MSKSSTLLNDYNEVKELSKDGIIHEMLKEIHRGGFKAKSLMEDEGHLFMKRVNDRAETFGLYGKRIGSLAEALVYLEENLEKEEELKRIIKSWEADPCWDLEDAGKTEEEKKYLLNYRKEYEDNLESKRHEQLISDSKTMGIENNLKLTKYILRLEEKIERLEEKLDNLRISY